MKADRFSRKSSRPTDTIRGATICFLAACLALALSTSAAPAQKNKGRQISDQGIADAIETKLIKDPGVPAHSIDIVTTDGIVTLSGSVDHVLAKERAVAIARSIRGVRSVTDQLAVKPAYRPDAEIRKDIEQALFLDPAADSYQTSVKVKDGTVTLAGAVESWQEKNLAAHVAKGVKGVKALENEIVVKYPRKRSDAEIEADIRGALKRNVWIPNSSGLGVQVNQGQVTLSGTVGSALSRSEARKAAWAHGVTNVDHSQLKVDPNSTALQRRSLPLLKDAEIKEAITDALLFDPRVNSFNPQIEVRRGVVTLRGTVDNLKAKRAAEANARNTVGVQMVRNFLKVRSKSQPRDAEIEKNIASAFSRDPYLANNAVEVSVVNGKAYLSGRVDTFFERWQADDIASRIKGVSDVENHLGAGSSYHGRGYGRADYRPYSYSYYPPFRPETDRDWQLEQDIEEELFWSPFVDADEVSVTVDDGVATLSGTVDSFFERGAAIDNAYQAGAAAVKNELKVNNE